MKQGPTASVFGYQHNDHRWLEVFCSGTWIPADATLGVCGEPEWLAARMGFGPRPEAAKDMIVPIMVFAMDAVGRVQEDRTEHYLISLFEHYVEGKVPPDAPLREWTRLVRMLARGGQRAFEGDESFFQYGDLIQRALDVYLAIGSQYRQAE